MCRNMFLSGRKSIGRREGDHMKNNPYSALLLIPILVVINIIVFCVSSLIDTQVIPWIYNNGGHLAPVFVLLSFIVLPIIDVIVVVIAIGITLVRVFRGRNRQEEK